MSRRGRSRRRTRPRLLASLVSPSIAPGTGGRPPPPGPAAPAGELGFPFDRSGYRVPAIIVSPWVEPGSVYNEEYRHTSLIATLRKTWGLGKAFTGRDASAPPFHHLFLPATP